MGARESGPERLEEAATAYRAALEVWTRALVPLDSAMTQNNLGHVLTTLGERDDGADQLEQAVKAYRPRSRREHRERVPLDWASTQNDFGMRSQRSANARMERRGSRTR